MRGSVSRGDGPLGARNIAPKNGEVSNVNLLSRNINRGTWETLPLFWLFYRLISPAFLTSLPVAATSFFMTSLTFLGLVVLLVPAQSSLS
jgi:hypothetical protein